MDIFTISDLPLINNLIDSARRESLDSGLSLSPSSPMVEATNPAGAKKRNKKKKRLASTLSYSNFHDLYKLKNEVLGQGSYGRVETCTNVFSGKDYAVKIINKEAVFFNRKKMMKEIDLYHWCVNHESIIQLIDYFEEDDKFYLIFEKASGGHLLDLILEKKSFAESQAALIIQKLAKALKYLHSKGIAHRDLKPENVLIMDQNQAESSVKLCDFDLCSPVQGTVTTPRLQSPVGSPDYMAPEVVDLFLNEDNIMYDLLEEDEDITYDKRCDLWSLGVIAYTLLCGYLPFKGNCGRDCGWSEGNEECYQCQQGLFHNIKSANFVFLHSHWMDISNDAKDLILRLLRVNPDERIEAADVLDHPWIQAMTKDSSATKQETKTPVVPIPIQSNPKELRSTPPKSPKKANSQFWLKTSGDVSNKFRRQSSVANFCQNSYEDLLSRCEFWFEEAEEDSYYTN